jgi:hypothetical protein
VAINILNVYIGVVLSATSQMAVYDKISVKQKTGLDWEDRLPFHSDLGIPPLIIDTAVIIAICDVDASDVSNATIDY